MERQRRFERRLRGFDSSQWYQLVREVRAMPMEISLPSRQVRVRMHVGHAGNAEDLPIAAAVGDILLI